MVAKRIYCQSIATKRTPLGARLLFYLCLFFSSLLVAQDVGTQAERLWKSMEVQEICAQVSSQFQLSRSDSLLFFMEYLPDKIEPEQDLFFEKVAQGTFTQEVALGWKEKIKEKVVKECVAFLKNKKTFEAAVSIRNASTSFRMEAVNGPCTNMGFETGNFSGWTGEMQDRNIGNNNLRPVLGPLTVSFPQHCIMKPGMRDPFIPTLPVVPPGKTSAVRLGNVAQGGHVARLRQTFKVDSSNMIFTYRYAVILHDPDGSEGHEDLGSPHFRVVMTTENGDTNHCAGYSVVVRNDLPKYIHVCGAGGGEREIKNVGCPAGATGYDGAGTFNGSASVPSNDQCRRNSLDLYYKSWSTVSIVLDDYLGKNVTVEFTAADCVPGGHLGYAYLNAECSRLQLGSATPICSGKQTKTLSAPEGFAGYKWSGPGIVGANNTRNITINRSGTYQITLIPESDDPCPNTQTIVVKEYCPPVPELQKTLCETMQGSGKALGVDLTSYDLEMQGGEVDALVQSWHSALPANTSNKIARPQLTDVAHGSQFYAVVTRPVGTDTIRLTFTIYNKPKIEVPDQVIRCTSGGEVSLAVQAQLQDQDSIRWDANALVRWSKQFEANTMVALSSTYPEKKQVKLIATAFKSGCTKVSDSLLVELHPIPKVRAFPDSLYCANIKDIPLRGEIKAAESVSWTVNHLKGSFANSNALATSFQKGDPHEMATSFFVLTANSSICGSASDSVEVRFVATPSLSMPTSYKYCSETDPPVVLQANGFKWYKWYSSEGLIGTSPSVKVAPNGTARYSLVVQNEGHCKDSIEIEVREVCSPRLFVPNVITPESRDINAALHIYGAHYTHFEITIFSRWGEVIFNTKDPKHVWDGVFRNENMPIGTYPWIVTYEGDSEEYKGPYKKQGEVTVVR